MAKVKILVEGYLSKDTGGHTCPTISLVEDDNIKMIVDPGSTKDQDVIVNALKKENLTSSKINYICLTHDHVDHFKNIGMFSQAKIVEYFGIWGTGDIDPEKDLPETLSENIQIIKTPGHDRTGISLIVKTDLGRIAIVGDVFWQKDYPKKDIYASDVRELNKSRAKILKLADYIIPGHGKMYKVKD